MAYINGQEVLFSPKVVLVNSHAEYFEEILETQTEMQNLGVEVENVTVNGREFPNISEAVQDVYDEGKKAQYDLHWDIKQNYGERKDWRYAFLSSEGLETDETLRPKYDIECEQGESMFYGLSQVTKLKKGFYGEEDLQIDTSKMTVASWMFFNMKSLLELPTLNFTRVFRSAGAFYGCNSLTKLHLIVSEDTVFEDNTFIGCNSLTGLTIEGTIGKDANFSGCTSLSGTTVLMQIMANLKDYSGTDTTHTLVLGEVLIERLLNTYHLAILEATEKGWTVV